MKTPKCPLCGKMPEYVRFMVGEEECDHICCTCGLCTSPISGLLGKTQCWEDWSELVAKFPPIMRLGQGDNVMVRFSDDTHTVLYTNVDRGKIYLQDVYGNALPYDVDEIKQWPWEIEQKGVQQ